MSFEVNPSALKQAGYAFGRHEILIPAGTPFSALTIPEYWTNVGRQLRRFGTIRVVAEDGSFDAELCVANDPNAHGGQLPFVQIRVLRYWAPEVDEDGAALLAETAEADEADFTVGWGGPAQKHRVVDPAGSVVRHGFESKAEAAAWLETHKAERAGRLAA